MPPGPGGGQARGAQEFLYGGNPQAAQPGVAPPAATGTPPADPYATTGTRAAARATLQGAAGVFTIVPGVEMRAGRDGAQCGILLAEPRVSGVHATLKLEGGQLLVRDENSNNGTLVNGNKLTPGTWSSIMDGSLVRFGPVEFNTRLEF
jgi:pSer/pThr/pTyr-binding forkhead associated (FHA) protein